MYNRFIMTGGIESQHAVIADAIKSTLVEACTAEYKTSILDFCFHSCTELNAYLDQLESKHDGIVEDTKHILDYSRTSGVISELLQMYDIRMISGAGRAFSPSCYDKLPYADIQAISFNSTALHILRWTLYRSTDQRASVIGDDGREQYAIGMKNLQHVMLPYDVRAAMLQQLDVIFSMTLERIRSRPWDCNVATPLIIPHISSSVELVATSGSSIQSNDAVIDWYMDQLCDIFVKRINAVLDLPFPISLEYDKRNCSVRIVV